MRNRDSEARIFIRGDELKALKKLSSAKQVNLTEMVRILITNAERAGVNDDRISRDI